jgi:hypothetical protein
MGQIQSWKCVVNDEVKVYLNDRALKENKFYFGKIVARNGSIVSVECPTLQRTVRVHVRMVRVIKPVLTDGRLKKQMAYRFKVLDQKRPPKAKKEITNKVGDMSFTYTK